MSEDKDLGVSMIELHEEFIQHIESGGRKIKILALVATLAGGFFATSYFLQLVVVPYGMGIKSQTVNLVDPGLMALEAVGLAVALLWFFAGIRDLLFQGRLEKRVKEIRSLQAQVAVKYGLENRPPE